MRATGGHIPTWRLAARVARYRLGLFTTTVVLLAASNVLMVLIGLFLRWVFDALSGAAPAGLGVHALVAVLVAVEVARMAVVWGGVVWTLCWERMSGLLRLNLLRAQMQSGGPDAGATLVSTGEAVSRFRDDTDDFLWFLDTAAVTEFLGEVFGAVLAVKAAHAAPAVLRRNAMLNQRRGRAVLRDQVLAQLLDAFNTSTVDLGIGLVLLLASSAMHRGDFTVGELVLFASYASTLVDLPYYGGRMLVRYRQAGVAAERLAPLLPAGSPAALVASRPLYVSGREPPAPVSVPATRHDPLQVLEVRGLSASHPTSGRGVHDLDLVPGAGLVHGRQRSGRRGQDHATARAAWPHARRERHGDLARAAGGRPRHVHGPAPLRLRAASAPPVQRVARGQRPPRRRPRYGGPGRRAAHYCPGSRHRPHARRLGHAGRRPRSALVRRAGTARSDRTGAGART